MTPPKLTLPKRCDCSRLPTHTKHGEPVCDFCERRQKEYEAANRNRRKAIQRAEAHQFAVTLWQTSDCIADQIRAGIVYLEYWELMWRRICVRRWKRNGEVLA